MVGKRLWRLGWEQLLTGVFAVLAFQACSWKSDKTSQPGVSNDWFTAGVHLPFGTIQISPSTRGDTASNGYLYTDSIITGFVLSYIGEDTTRSIHSDRIIRFFPTVSNIQEAVFHHKYEVIKPGYYSVYMEETDIAVELTATRNVSFQRYFFPPKDNVQVFVDKKLALLNDSVMSGQSSATYFVIQLSRPPKEISEDADRGTVLYFDATEEEMLYIKTSISSESPEKAWVTLSEELPGWSFEAASVNASGIWNKYLTETSQH